MFQRQIPDGAITFHYKLFDPDSFRAELTAAGLAVEVLRAESLFPEAWVTRHAACRAFEACLGTWLPPALGYGMIAVARSGSALRKAEP